MNTRISVATGLATLALAGLAFLAIRTSDKLFAWSWDDDDTDYDWAGI